MHCNKAIPISMAYLHSFTFTFLFLFLQTPFFISEAAVPSSQTFKFVNAGGFGKYPSEYFGDYRPLDIFTSPFQLCFYNQTPTAFTLSLRMGLRRSHSLMRWVWEANRGNPVGENATLTFGTDGNLVLADADGRVAWQTGTANKGVVGFKLLSNGNMVLHDSKGKFLWQSFDSPTDTLLVGQTLRFGGATKLVSRASRNENVNGPYSVEIEPTGLAMYYQPKRSSKPVLYYSTSVGGLGTLQNLTFIYEIDNDENGAEFLRLRVGLNTTDYVLLSRPKCDGILSMLRLEMDGNINVYTYNNKVGTDAWEIPYTLFSIDSDTTINECHLPERCGNFGLCEDNQCVACPSSNGLLMGWSKDCQVPKVSSCGVKDFHYYKLQGVDHFTARYNMGYGPIKENECENKCSKDCSCLGYFYDQETSRCWIAYDLKTLIKVDNFKHLGYIKVPNH